MPRFDRTGPERLGPRTGRMMGKCNPNRESNGNNANNDFPDEDFRRHGFGRGFGRGAGRGFRFGRRNR